MSIAHCNKSEPLNVITPAKIDWQMDDTGNMVPVSGEFGDVYFSHADGLAESRYVFLAHNRLPERLACLAPKQCFTIAELGFGTGLNLLATWLLWRQLRETHPQLATARLHFITTEKFPIPLADLTHILALWGQRAPELVALIAPLLAAYPPLIAGCHRLNFFDDNLTVDMWFGDAAESLAKLALDTSIKPTPCVNAWFLDGFAPSCNSTLWAEDIFTQIERLSCPNTTAATYSSAGVVKRGLREHGFEINKVKGFGRKNQMLTAVMTDAVCLSETNSQSKPANSTYNTPAHSNLKPDHSIVIGAGVSGLLTAWALANRGIKVTLLDKSAPLAGASGNPRALLAPKMTPIHHVDEHLHTMGYLYSSRLYRVLNEIAAQQNIAAILEPTGALDLLIKANIGTAQIADYPDEMATTLSLTQAQDASGLKTQDVSDNLYLPQSGLVNPQALKETILTHPLIHFQQLAVNNISEMESHICVEGYDQNQQVISINADNVVVCAAFESHQLDKRIFDCRKIRGQLSWFTPTAKQLASLPKIPLKYSGYCTLFTAQTGDGQLNDVIECSPQFLLGASFIRNDTSTDIRDEEHQISRDKLVTAIPELASVVPTDMSLWQGRAGIRTQTPDYHPIVGSLSNSERIWVMSAMGAKGYAIAPLCAEALVDMMLGSFTPLSTAMLARLSPNRTRLQTPLT
ncbi:MULTISPECIES: FAD-dependent 5-carboxymethylaminomethyl-2-thiouridine(34) oxidoreductase MnmC [unclassified Psychrobacter]|uniref:FAD-dependent 5-carboxymethylaminomethyl-2-thiouridine(34) oxidoreductase MnmC n=1 Tax=unclassified Psychrobacter TaxID=196806 RepID=UPI0025B3AF66|nr:MULTISPECIES: FAD-dependent 5-carboxymethylaminomethyl-2-thiouridine(34) oxidoreductase MnmC [unclassified Psychrobacter]MDN3452497.1 FAD-dependent 5-carboxymethylaminomethyl-2-thiouridine(34) oxidoreductase MnmC [Psychrobacter sp. APC 3350]MDN3502363.1 FAD-dependent 5-carboxymethylaminomethyl-2-thiouridine(34) oxidoreductase MnmC [Psychrobacter sp. 5A.1]